MWWKYLILNCPSWYSGDDWMYFCADVLVDHSWSWSGFTHFAYIFYLLKCCCAIIAPYFKTISVFLISSYGTPLAQRASYLALHSYLFGPVAQLIMIILSLTALPLLTGSRCIPNGTRSNLNMLKNILYSYSYYSRLVQSCSLLNN